MAIDLNQREIIEALGNLDFNTMGMRGLSALGSMQNIGTNLAGGYSGNMPVIQPTTDPTYRSGFDYARSIAGGMPMEQVIAPGVSYSPEMPGGYTQEQLNTPVETPPPPPPVQEPDIPSFLGTGIGGVRIPVDRTKLPPLRDIFTGVPMQPPVQTPPAIDIDAIRQQIAESGIDFGNLLGIPKYEAPDLSQFVRREDIPTIPTFEQPDLSGFARLEDIPQIPTREDFLSIAREGIDIPQYQAPDLSAYDTRIAELEQELAGLKQPTGGRFSIEQQRPMGLFV